MATVAVTDATFEELVLKSDKPVIVDFWAEWCGPCKAIGPALEELAATFSDQVTIAKLNIDENPMVPSKFGVRGIPTLIAFKGGERIETRVGAAPKAQLEQFIRAQV